MRTIYDEYIGLLNKGYGDKEAWFYLLKATKRKFLAACEKKDFNNIKYYYNQLNLIKEKIKS